MWCPWFSVLLISANFVAGVGGMVVCCVRCCVGVTVTWIHLISFNNWSRNIMYHIRYISGSAMLCFVWIQIPCWSTLCGLYKIYNQVCFTEPHVNTLCAELFNWNINIYLQLSLFFMFLWHWETAHITVVFEVWPPGNCQMESVRYGSLLYECNQHGMQEHHQLLACVSWVIF